MTEADDDSTEFVTADTHLVLEVLVKELTESTVPLDSSDDSAENHLSVEKVPSFSFFISSHLCNFVACQDFIRFSL